MENFTFFVVFLILAVFLAVKIAITDMRRRIIPDAYLFPLLVLGFIITTYFQWVCSPQEAVIGMVFGYILSAAIGFCFDRIMIKRNPSAETPIGMGDIKLITTGGLWSGPSCLALALVFACIFGGIWSIAKKQKFIPFAPFFIAGEILSLIIFAFLI